MAEQKLPVYFNQITTGQCVGDNSTTANNHNNSIIVLDKLEESYWAQWKPKKYDKTTLCPYQMDVSTKLIVNKTPQEFNHAENHEICNKSIAHNTNDIIKYFHGKNIKESSTTIIMTSNSSNNSHTNNNLIETLLNEKLQKKKSLKKLINRRQQEISINNELISQEIQTDIHCPLVDTTNQPSTSTNVAESLIIANKPKEMVPLKDNGEKQSPTNYIENEDDIIKKKSLSLSPGNTQRPKQVYRKSITSTTAPFGGGYTKGGSYPLKSSFKNGNLSNPNGNFHLGPPGSVLFVTRGSFSSHKKKY